LYSYPSISNSNEQADWAELCCLFTEEQSLSKSEFRATIEQDKGDVETNKIIENIWAEITWRNRNGNSAYPIEISSNRIKKKSNWKNYLPYTYMLLLSRHHFYPITQIDTQDQQYYKLFERLTNYALRKYLEFSINIGSPRTHGVPAVFKDALQLTSQLCNENICPEPSILRYAKDGEVDNIAWIPLDKRSGQVILLLQCTIERKWYRKPKIDVDTWCKIIDFSVQPIPGLAFPYIEHEQWHDYSLRKGLLLDRMRISKLTSKSYYLRNKMKVFCKMQIDKIKG